LERESAKVASDLTAKLAAAETAKEESSTLAGELQKELINLKAENERLKEGPVRAIKRTGEEVGQTNLGCHRLMCSANCYYS
jgi:hypothetical protein